MTTPDSQADDYAIAFTRDGVLAAEIAPGRSSASWSTCPGQAPRSATTQRSADGVQ